MSRSTRVGAVVFSLAIAMGLCAFNTNEPAHRLTPFIYDIPTEIPPPAEPADNPTTVEGVALGRKLFYDKMLSGNHSKSCASCHNPDKYFTDAQRVSDGINGRKARRNAMPLFNMAWIDNFFWDGRVRTLEEVIVFPLTDTNEMGKHPETLIKELQQSKEYPELYETAFGSREINLTRTYRALAQYLRTITSYRSPVDSLYVTANTIMKKEHIGQAETMQKLFGFSDKTVQTLQLCERCHSNITYGNNSMRNNGLDANNESDKGLGAITGRTSDVGLFKAPTFRNVMYTGPYMHDGRFTTLEEVLEHYNSGIQNNPNLDPVLKDSNGNPLRLNLSQKDKEEILYFLKDLMTDGHLSYN